MKWKPKHFWLILSILLLATFFPTTAFAYFDPGTGSMVLQMLGVAFIAMSGFFVVFKNRILAFFNKRKKNDSAAGDDDMDEADCEDEEGAAEDTAKPVTPFEDSPDDAD